MTELHDRGGECAAGTGESSPCAAATFRRRQLDLRLDFDTSGRSLSLGTPPARAMAVLHRQPPELLEVQQVHVRHAVAHSAT